MVGYIDEKKNQNVKSKTPTHASGEASFVNAGNVCPNSFSRERFRIVREREKENFKRKVRSEQLRLIAGRSSRWLSSMMPSLGPVDAEGKPKGQVVQGWATVGRQIRILDERIMLLLFLWIG